MVGAKHTPFPHDFIDPDPKSNKILVASSSLPFSGVTKLKPISKAFNNLLSSDYEKGKSIYLCFRINFICEL